MAWELKTLYPESFPTVLEDITPINTTPSTWPNNNHLSLRTYMYAIEKEDLEKGDVLFCNNANT